MSTGAKVKGAFGNIMGYLYGVILVLILLVGPILDAIDLDSRIERTYYLTDIQIAKAKVAEHDSENGKYYIRVDTYDTNPKLYSSNDDLWIEVTPDFYKKHSVGLDVGVLFGNYDVLKGSLFGNDKKPERSFWGVHQVYDSLDAAKEANPQKKYRAPAALVDKKINKNGDKYFVLESNGKKYRIFVKPDAFEKMPVGKVAEAEFESTGDFEKLVELYGKY